MNRRILTALAWTTFAGFGGMFGVLAWEHIRYPGYTEAMEGDVLQAVERAATGKSIYPAPTSEYIALAYMPGYYFACAPAYRLFGDSLAGPRLVSTLFTLGSAAVLAFLAWKQTELVWTAPMTAALFLSGYRSKDAVLTTALPDSMLLFWIVLGWAILVYGKRWWHDLLWLGCFALAFWTKQHGALYFGLAVLYALLTGRQRRWPLFVGALLLAGPTAFWTGEFWLGDHFRFFTLDMPAGWERSWRHSIQRMAFVLAMFVPFALVLAVQFARSRRSLLRWHRQPFVWAAATALVACLYTVSATGSANNHYIPAFAMLDLLAVLGAAELAEIRTDRILDAAVACACAACLGMYVVAANLTEGHPLPAHAPIVAVALSVVWLTANYLQSPTWVFPIVLLVGQFAVNAYRLPDFLPDPKFGAAVADFRREIRRLDGDVVWSAYGYVPQSLSETTMRRSPSWVTLEDLSRTSAKRNGIQLAVPESNAKHLLSDDPIESVPVWDKRADRWVLVEDFGTRFSGLRQIAVHWFGGRSYPRYLYRKVEPAKSATDK
jgi:4-amino-4-deoxy-L-arabinose transferase-like glycosyltransferase